MNLKNFISTGSFGSLVSLLKDMVRREHHQARLLKYFGVRPELRMKLVESIYKGAAPASQNPTRDEIIAVLVLLGSAQPIDQVLRRVEQFSLVEWSVCFDDKFFSLLEKESRSLRLAGFFRDGRNLVKVGAAAAWMHNQNEWAQRLDNRIKIELAKQISDQPFLKQSGW
ncbi:MAG: hypothetical protein ACK2U3_08645 [Anaerolineales bacterium]|jgi:hypothetical protein